MSKNTKTHTDIAQQWEDKRKKAIRIIAITVFAIAALIAALCVLDWTLFDPILTHYNYEATVTTNTILCAALALASLVIAIPIALFLRKSLNKETRTPFSVFVLALCLLIEVAFIVVAWRVRAQQYESNADVGMLFNVLQIVFVIVVLVAHVIADRAIERQWAIARVCEGERDYLNHLNYLSQFETTSAQDRSRRMADFRALVAACNKKIQELFDSLKSSRGILAKHVAQDAEDVDAIMRTPYLVGSKEIADEAEAEAEIRSIIKVPTMDDIHDVYGAPINGAHIDASVEKTADEFEQRHHDIVSTYSAVAA